MGDLHERMKRRQEKAREGKRRESLTIIIGEKENGDLVIGSMECCLSEKISYIG